MERRVDLSNLDLDQAAGAIEARRSGWLARGLTVHPATWMDNDAEWPRPLLTERSEVSRPRSLGLRVEGDDGAEAIVVVYAGGWADVDLVEPAGDDVVSDCVELDAVGEFGALLDRVMARLVLFAGSGGEYS